MKKNYKENHLGKCALLWALECAFDLNGRYGTDSLYENNVKFQFDGHKCRLLSVDSVNYGQGYITMVVLAKGVELNEWENVRLNFLATHFRYETLYKIVEEFYMSTNACANDTWGDDVDAFIKEKCANWFDSYDSAMD